MLVKIQDKEFDLPIGEYIHVLGYKEKTIYGECPACNNNRTVIIDLSGNKYNINCPRCSSLHIKGDTDTRMLLKEFNAMKYYITGFKLNYKTNYDKPFEIELTISHGYSNPKNFRPCVETYTIVNNFRLGLDIFSIFGEVFKTEEECKKKAKELNAEQRKLKEEFYTKQGKDNG